MEKERLLRFLPAGDTALVAEFGDIVDKALNGRVHSLRNAIAAARIPGVIETVPTFRSLLIHYDPLLASGDALEAAIQALTLTNASIRPVYRLWHLPVCYE